MLSDVAPEPEPYTSDESPYRPKPINRAKVLRFLKSVQKYSAYGITAFAGLHLTSTVLLPAFSPHAADSAFMAGRSVYQSAIGEPLLVYGAFGAHILSGLILRVHRAYLQYTEFGRFSLGHFSLTSVSGSVLTILVAAHFAALRWVPVAVLGDSSLMSLDYIVYSLKLNWFKTGGALALLVTVFTLHGVFGASQYFRSWKNKSKTAKLALGTGVIALALASLCHLGMQDAAHGWLADQFMLIHNKFDALLPWP